MDKFTLVQEESTGNKIVHEFTSECLSEVLRRIRYFLQGASFVIRPEEDLIIDATKSYIELTGAKKVRKKK